MGKKIDLNKPINSNNNSGKKNHHFSNYNKIPQLEETGEQNEKNTPSQIEKQAANIAMRMAGVPKGIANTVTKNETLYNAANQGTFTMKIPLPIKITIITTILLVIPFIGLMLFVVLFSSNNSLGYGSFQYGTTCTKVTIVDTGCDANAQNCTNENDEEVTFEEYIEGVVLAEVKGAEDLELYKALAIAARTYALNEFNNDCTIKGNAAKQSYESISKYQYQNDKELIKQAVKETEGLVMIKNDKLIAGNYDAACVVNKDDNSYYIKYGSNSLETANFQQIPKEWSSSDFYLKNFEYWWNENTSKDINDYEKRSCYNNHGLGMSQNGAYYLIKNENYNFEQVLRYYYGEDINIAKNEMQHGGVEGFINPTRIIYCTSAFGPRIHPIYNELRTHQGIDLAAMPEGEPIYAAKSGTVTYVCKNAIRGKEGCGSGGNSVYIDHGDGTKTAYLHMAYGTIPNTIYAGATVNQGEQIGGVGTTGDSTGFHLHYSVQVNGEYVNPADYIDWTNGTDRNSCRK